MSTYSAICQEIDLDIVNFNTSARNFNVKSSNFPAKLKGNEGTLKALGISFIYTPPDDIVTTTMEFFISDGTTDLSIAQITLLPTEQLPISMGAPLSPNYILDYTKTYKLYVTVSYRIPSEFDETITNSENLILTIEEPTNKIINNTICCDQSVLAFPANPKLLSQFGNSPTTEDNASIISSQWQEFTLKSNTWKDIPGATQLSYDPPSINESTRYRRVLTSSSGRVDISKDVFISSNNCQRPHDQINTICSDQIYFNLKHGDVIKFNKILGSYITPNIPRREFGFDYLVSTDGIIWITVKAKQIIDASTDGLVGGINAGLCDTSHNTNDIKNCIIKNGFLDLELPDVTFNINKGPIQHLFIRRDYYHWYDEFNCGFLNTFSCGAQWHLENSSNTAIIILTTGDLPKPVLPITSSKDNVTCNWSDQTINFSVPQLNNGEYYKWDIPSSWTAYTALQGPYVHQISVNTNNAEKNFAQGGEVCLTVLQGSKIDRQCKTITGTSPFYSIIPTAPITACEGQVVILKPVLVGPDTNPDHYTYNWAAYQSPIQSCNNPAGSNLANCKELKITVGNVRQNPNQEVTLTTTNAAGCIYKSTSKLTTAPGLQMGILNTYNDPAAIANSGLAVNTSTNNLFFTAKNKNIYRTYYDNTDKIWKYVPLKDKNTNKAILSDGPVAYYQGATNKLFYIISSALFYAESTDNGLTWIDKYSSGPIITNIDPRIKVYGNNIYYIDLTSRNVSYKDISTTNSAPVLVGTVTVNYSQSMFTVEDGILTYANPSNVIVAFDAITGTNLLINVPTPIKQVNYNSSISVYNKNIYFTSSYGSSGALKIIKRNISTGIYDNYEDVPGLQLAGPFAINKQTGTLYAKAYDVLGKQIYYLNNVWNTAPIVNYFSYSPIQSDMVYANGHAYYIGDNGYVSNTYYIAPCVPQVLRTANTVDETGDVINDPLSNTITEDRSVILYPNPTNNLVKATITIPQESMVQIKIIPITGGSTDIKYNATTESGTQDLSFDMSSYAAGIYIVQVYVNGSLYANSKLIKY